MKIIKPCVTLEWATPEPALAIERIARTCYRSEGKIEPGSVAVLIGKLKARGHLAMLEHASASLRFVCDRGVSHELVRHRLVAYAQESTRYCNYSGDKFGGEISVIVPPGIGPCDQCPACATHNGLVLCATCRTWVAWRDSVAEAERSYLAMLDLGTRPEIARSVLPTCLATQIVATANFREWLHILSLRTAPAAHPQMREVMAQAQEILVGVCPEVFGA